MESAPTRVLVVANKTATSDAVLDAVRQRAARGPCAFTLLVPISAPGLHRLVNPEDVPDTEAVAVLDRALPLMSQAAGAPVDGRIGVPEPLAAIQDAINLVGFDEVIVSTLPHRVSRWLHLDLPSKVAGLGLPVTTVTGEDSTTTDTPSAA
ncbi:MAG: hypothetical protein JWO02_2205 [Solirubrobacterales bacterium]|nr:hypothetical protein [Solirubrobacterales bacterium]